MDNKVNIHTDQPELTITERVAKHEKRPNSVNVEGTLLAPYLFIKDKYLGGNDVIVIDKDGDIDHAQKGQETIYHPVRSRVEYDLSEGRIRLVLNEKNPHHTDTITGQLRESDDLAEFRINQDGKFFSLNDVIKLVKRNKFKFTDPGEQASFLTTLMSFNAQVTTKFKNYRDNGGNSTELIERTVAENKNAPVFKLTAYLFEGYPKETIMVQTCIDASSNSILFYFESEDLYSLLEEKREKAVADELEKFSKGFPCAQVQLG